MPKIIDRSQNADKIGIVLAPILSSTVTGGSHHRAQHDYTRDIKLQGENYFGNPNMAQLYLLDKAWPLIEASAKSKPGVDIKALRARHLILLDRYKGIASQIAELKGVEKADIEGIKPHIPLEKRGFILKDVSKLPDADGLSASLKELLIAHDNVIALGSLRGGAIQGASYGAKLEALQEKLEKSIAAIKEYNTRRYDEVSPEPYNSKVFKKLYKEYRDAAQHLKLYLKSRILPNFQSQSTEHATIRRKCSDTIRAIDNEMHQSYLDHFQKVDPYLGLELAQQKYENALEIFYSTYLQEVSTESEKELPESVLVAHRELEDMLIAVKKIAPEASDVIDPLIEKHLQDKLYLKGKLNAKHIRHQNPAPDLIEETFDHRELWSHLEDPQMLADVEAFKGSLYQAVPIAKELSTSLGQGFFNTTDHSMTASFNLHQPIPGEIGVFTPHISQRNLNISFDEGGKPNIDLKIEYDYILDIPNKKLFYADEQGKLVLIDFNKGEYAEKYQYASEIMPKDAEAVLAQIKGRRPVASIKYNLSLDLKDADTLFVSQVNKFEVTAADGLTLPQDVSPLVFADQSFKEASDKGLNLRKLCVAADIPITDDNALDRLERDWQTPGDKAQTATHIDASDPKVPVDKTEHFKARKQAFSAATTKALEESEDNKTPFDPDEPIENEGDNAFKNPLEIGNLSK